MFVAWRDLRFAEGRFILITAVVLLLTLLVGFLTGLTAGLANQNISGVMGLPGDTIVFSEPQGDDAVSYDDSSIDAAQQTAWANAEGVVSALPLGITTTRVEAGDSRASITIFGTVQAVNAAVPPTDGLIALPKSVAADLDVRAGDAVTISGQDYTVSSVTPETWYSHMPVVWMTATDWRAITMRMTGDEAFASVLVATTTDAFDREATDASAQTVSEGVIPSLFALSAFRSEIGSLLLIVGMLFAISALVVGAFFTVWTMQRRGDVAVLKALGASTRSLLIDSLGQSAVVLLVGVGLGIGLTALAGLAISGSGVPFVLSWYTTLLPGIALIVLGLVGAAVALRPVFRTDPLTALGSNR